MDNTRATSFKEAIHSAFAVRLYSGDQDFSGDQDLLPSNPSHPWQSVKSVAGFQRRCHGAESPLAGCQTWGVISNCC
jgi:hypothetical protein